MAERRIRIAIPSGNGTVQNYLDALHALGAKPAIVEMDCRAEDYDGLLLPGGGDVAPHRFGQEPCGSEEADEALDELQLCILDRFVAAQKPVLGICRGHQVINIYFGGDLIQDLGPEKNSCHRRENGQDKIHTVDARSGSWLCGLYGTRLTVNSAHHQGLGKLGDGLSAISVSPDGVVEGLSHETLPVISVQWHPERMGFAHKRSDAADGSLVWQYFLQLCSS